jgi:hypothetical protein
MSYVGRSVNYGNAATDSFVGNGGATYTLTYETPTAAAIISLDGVIQKNGTDFNITGTSLVFTSVVAAPIVIQVVYLGLSLSLGTPADNTVDETKLKDALVGDFTDATVTASDTFLHGDATDSGNTKRDTVQGILDLVHGTTVGLQTIWIPALAMVSPTTNGAEAAAVETTAVKPEMKVLDFDSSTIEYAQFSIAMPKSWDEGTVTAKFYWTHATAVATDVMWAIQGVCISDNDTIDATFGTAIVVTDTFHNAAEDLAISPATTAITLGGSPAEDDLAYFQVYRAATTAGDTTNSTDARLIGVKILFTTNAENDA